MDGIAKKPSECNCLNLGKIPEGDGLYQVIKPKGELDKAFVHENHTTLPLLHFKALDKSRLVVDVWYVLLPCCDAPPPEITCKKGPHIPPSLPRPPRSLSLC